MHDLGYHSAHAQMAWISDFASQKFRSTPVSQSLVHALALVRCDIYCKHHVSTVASVILTVILLWQQAGRPCEPSWVQNFVYDNTTSEERCHSSSRTVLQRRIRLHQSPQQRQSFQILKVQTLGRRCLMQKICALGKVRLLRWKHKLVMVVGKTWHANCRC